MTRVSVVIIGRNEGQRLQSCIASALAIAHPGFDLEVLYVDSNSTDGSVALAHAAAIQTIVLQQPRLTAAVARNAGWHACHGDFVLFLDGDTVVHPQFVHAALPAFDDPHVAAVCGDRVERFPNASLYNRVFDLDWNGPPGPVAYCGGDALFRRQALEASQGYDDGLLAGEEPELCTRLRIKGWIILRLALPMTIHDLAMTRFRQYWDRSVRTGHAYAEVSARFRGTPIPLWSKEARHNKNHVRLTMLLLGVSLATALLLHCWLPLAIAAGIVLLMVLRSAWKARPKSQSITTLLLYGLHSHLQQLPIYLGQQKYARSSIL